MTDPGAKVEPEEGDRAAGESRRSRIVRRFEAWLDEALDNEDLIEGAAADLLSELERDGAVEGPGPDRRCDLYALWSAMTALAQEVKLQARAFRQLTEALAPLVEAAPALASSAAVQQKAHVELRQAVVDFRAFGADREKEIAKKAGERAMAGSIDLLLDLRDRLFRGLAQARAAMLEPRAAKRPAWLDRIFGFHREPAAAGTRPVEALLRGYELVVERLDDALRDLGIREINCLGRPFDPRSMRAVEVTEVAGTPDGTVLEVRRAGYERHGEPYRLADVKVARAARAVPVRNTDADVMEEGS